MVRVCSKKMRLSALVCLGAHLLQASGFYHGETLPTNVIGQPDPAVASPTDLPFEAAGAGNSTAHNKRSTRNSTVAQGHHVFNADADVDADAAAAADMDAAASASAAQPGGMNHAV